MKKISLLLLLILFSLGIQSCKKEKIEEQHGAYEKGIIITHEGNFQQGNASISFIKDDLSKIENGIFKKINNQNLGDVAQSSQLIDDEIYIVVNNSNKIEVVNKDDFKRTGTIATNLTMPRYVVKGNGNRAYVSCWGDTGDENDDYLAVINTENDKFMNKIPVELGPEKMIANDDYIFIAHKGAYGTNNKVTALNQTSLNKTLIGVGDRPNSLVLKDNLLFVLSEGEPSWSSNGETSGKLSVIDINNNFHIVRELTFNDNKHPNGLCINENYLYYNIANKIYKMDINSTSLPSNEFIDYNGSIYNMEINDGKLFIADAGDFQQEGKIIIYNLSNGQIEKSFDSGIIPNDFEFVK